MVGVFGWVGGRMTAGVGLGGRETGGGRSTSGVQL